VPELRDAQQNSLKVESGKEKRKYYKRVPVSLIYVPGTQTPKDSAPWSP
jgi:hypothetical protein